MVTDFSREGQKMRKDYSPARFALIFLIIMYFCLLMAPGPVMCQVKSYLIGPRDILNLTIHAGGEKQHDSNLMVSGQGMINVPFIGPIRAEGLTVNQLEERIIKPLAKDYFVDPEVNIHIKEYHSLQYYISGAVKAPGLYEMTSEATLMELIARAGGVLPERGNLAYILRSDTGNLTGEKDIEKMISKKEPLKVDLKSLLDEGDMNHNRLLQSGDVVYIPLEKALNLAESKVYVEGEIQNPGVYNYQPGLTALNACIMAGGFGKFAAPKRARIIRSKKEGQEIININLDDVKEGKIPDIELEPGDRIHIPETWL